ncbi:MAG: cyclopropane fatty acyl phospholipid synthase [Gammaproteobacteria bacterium]|nr:cyclopropane fatty acyl phospholipid synthase [Gammaproteobacteria bacterium]MYD75494.1 cyclopropane fatty acyl phospholipid synthase [Gammaproteobacteria bacterium]MYJ51297.1 cyclopropane fatty acyl phospholipid synthase [Gammaproteobacteria bacterium]
MSESSANDVSRNPSRFGRFALRRIQATLDGTGIRIDGPNPWDPQIRNPGFYARVLTRGSLGLGESYVDGWWECEQVDEFVNRILRSPVSNKTRYASHLFSRIRARVFNLQKKSRAVQVGEQHYDAGNDLYRAMLDERMVYTCGYWAHSDNLDDAQRDKLDLVCRKIFLKPGMRILDIGCGWGSFAKFAAEHYGAEVVGVTVSKEQVALGMELCKGLPVELRFQDYRDIDEKFDAVISLGMFEHVGHKNYRTYMEVVRNCLKDRGLFLLHTIGKNNSWPGVDPWISKYIFPNGEIPSLKLIAESVEPLMHIEDVHNFGPDYDRTLMSWCDNFIRYWSIRNNTPADERFRRMWSYYLKVCAGAFRARDLQLWQIVISKGAPHGAYRRPE